MITLCRVDERLIHGQVAHAWSKAYASDGILVVSDKHAKDKFQISLLELATPKGMKCFVKGYEDAATFINKFSNKKIMIVCESPLDVIKLVKAGCVVDTVNIGGIYHKVGRVQFSNTVYLNDEIKGYLSELIDMGVGLEVRATPTDQSIVLNKDKLGG